MATLITGGCGFIGSHLVGLLSEQGRELIVLDRLPEPPPTLSGVTLYASGAFGDRELLSQLFDQHEITEVIHLAATSVPGTSNQNPRLDVSSNVCETITLLEVCVERSVDKVIFLSSGGAIYGIPDSILVNEDHPSRPISSYGITKLAIEKYLHLFHHLHGLNYVVVRAANPFGPGQRPGSGQGVIGEFTRRILAGEELVVWGDGKVIRDYFHVKDLARFCASALASDATGVFNVGSGVGRSLLELIESMETRFGTTAKVRFEPGRALDVPKIVLDSAKARETFGWSPSIEFEIALDETREWITQEFL